MTQGSRSAIWAGTVAILLGLLAVVAAYQSRRPLFVDIGGAFDSPHTPGFYAPEQSGQATFRWSAANSTLLFPGIGKALSTFDVALQLSSGRGAGSSPIDVGVAVNGHSTAALHLGPDSKTYRISVQPEWFGVDGDLQLDFTSRTFKSGADKRELGFIADFARVDLPSSPILPSLTQLFWLALCGTLLLLCLRSLTITTLAASSITILFLIACALVVALQRLFLTVYTPRLAATLLMALMLAFVAERLTRWLTGVAGWQGERALPEWAWTGLRGLIMLTAALKIGGLLYPHTVIVDAYFHLKYITYMSEGRPWEQFFGKNLSLAVMPKEEWGAARAFIPYSPFFYFVASPLAKLPFPLAVTVPVVSGILDALKVPLVFILGLVLGGGQKAPGRALAATALYALTPATFLLQQWGNWPTLASLWLLTLWAALVCLFWGKMARPLPWIMSTVVLTLTLLSYTVTAAYTGVFVVLLVVGGWIMVRRDRSQWAAIGLSLVVAIAASLLIFYGQYISVMLNETLPTFGHAVQDQGKLTTLRPTLGGFLTGTIGRAMQSYNLAVIYGLALAGTLWLLAGSTSGARVKANRRGNSYGLVAGAPRSIPRKHPMDWRKVWLVFWLITFPLFTMLDFWVDQALKEFWFALPAIAVVGAAWVLEIKGKRLWLYSVLLWLLWGTLAWQSVSLWIFRLLFHNR